MKISKLLIKSAIIGAMLAASLPAFADSGSRARAENIQQINHLAAKVYDLQHAIVKNERVQYDELIRIESDSMFGGHAPSKDMLRYRTAEVLAHTFNGGDLQYLQSHLIQVKGKARQVIWLFPGLVGALRADNNQVLGDIVKGGNSSKGNQKYHYVRAWNRHRVLLRMVEFRREYRRPCLAPQGWPVPPPVVLAYCSVRPLAAGSA